MKKEHVISAPDVESIYDVPLNFEKDKLGSMLSHVLNLPNGKPTNLARCRGQATGMFNAAAFIPELNSFAVVGADLKATVFMYDAAGNLADAGFNLDVVGG